jgi:hypothetical protein
MEAVEVADLQSFESIRPLCRELIRKFDLKCTCPRDSADAWHAPIPGWRMEVQLFLRCNDCELIMDTMLKAQEHSEAYVLVDPPRHQSFSVSTWKEVLESR